MLLRKHSAPLHLDRHSNHDPPLPGARSLDLLLLVTRNLDHLLLETHSLDHLLLEIRNLDQLPLETHNLDYLLLEIRNLDYLLLEALSRNLRHLQHRTTMKMRRTMKRAMTIEPDPTAQACLLRIILVSTQFSSKVFTRINIQH